ncbi:MAG: acetylglutamate kinase [Spirosomataceae bacterium]
MQKLLVIKIGGNVIDNTTALKHFLEAFSTLPYHKILIHGGGKIATQIATKLNIETQMVEGRRITDQAMLDVVTMVYGGLVNKNIVAQLQSIGCNAIGLTGADAGIIRANKRPVKTIDYGFVGDVESVNSLQFTVFLKNGLVPIIAPLTFDPQSGSMLNTNADTMASAVAVALAATYEVNLVYCFEKRGVLSDPNDDNAVIPHLNFAAYTELKAEGVINKGMIPKLDNAFEALQHGVAKVTICHAEELVKAVEDGNAGTTLVAT